MGKYLTYRPTWESILLTDQIVTYMGYLYKEPESMAAGVYGPSGASPEVENLLSHLSIYRYTRCRKKYSLITCSM